MKIEKISETQIRCTLNRNDLADRHLRISELAYGSEKAKALFRDMMQQASTEFGFDAENIPLMIEAIPVSADCLILVITKVENPDELDTRFSNFTPAYDDAEDEEEQSIPLSGDATADQILQYFEQMSEMLADKFSLPEKLHRHSDASFTEKDADAAREESLPAPDEVAKHMVRAFRFGSLDEATALAKVISPFYHGANTLYKNPQDSGYHLVLQMSDHRPADFNKVCNITSEYGVQEHFTKATAAYFREHYECLIKDKAVAVLEKL